MKRVAIGVVILIASVAGVNAQSVVVEYLEGSVEVREGSSWYSISIGESVSSDAELRLGRGGYAEIADGSGTITLARQGTYDLSNIIKSAQDNRSANVGSLLFSRVKQVAGQREQSEQRDTAAGGVRASEAAQGPDISWAGAESASDLISDGLARLSEEDYNEAYFLFEEAYNVADSATANKAQFYMGYAAYLSGKQRQAVKALTRAELQPDSDYYTDHVLTLAQLYVETFAYQDAAELVEQFLEQGPSEDSARQTALLLAGLSHKGLENTSEARRYLREARSMDGSTAAGQTARQVLQQL
jgi:tetratricopeptide (TPR) repeat protein